jgi:CRISPR-associated exonuclease Cas4
MASTRPVYGRIAGDENRLVTGRADAVRYKDGQPHIVFDWKSDIAPEPSTRREHALQLALYVHILGAARGAVVYMTSGQIEWVTPAAPLSTKRDSLHGPVRRHLHAPDDCCERD